MYDFVHTVTVRLKTKHPEVIRGQCRKTAQVFWCSFSVNRFMERFKPPLCNWAKFHLVCFWLRCFYMAFYLAWAFKLTIIWNISLLIKRKRIHYPPGEVIPAFLCHPEAFLIELTDAGEGPCWAVPQHHVDVNGCVSWFLMRWRSSVRISWGQSFVKTGTCVRIQLTTSTYNQSMVICEPEEEQQTPNTT